MGNPATPTLQTRVSPITVEIVRGALLAIIREIEILIERTAVSSIIREKKDHFAGVFDINGQIIMGNMERHGPGKVDCILREFPRESFQPGDLFWYSDPFISGGAISHSQDACFVCPVFHEGELVAFFSTFGHFTDIGGSRPGSISPFATDIFQEGILVPPIRMYRAGTFNEDAYKIILRNTRLPYAMEGDTKAMMAGVQIGMQRLGDLFQRFGRDTVWAVFAEVMDRSEFAVQRYLDQHVADGRYYFEEFVDNDAVTDRPYKVALEMTKVGDELILDFSASDPQAKGAINFPIHPMNVAMILGNFLRSEDPEALLNQGTGRRFKVVLKPGTVVQPTFPAAVGLRSHTMFRIMGTLLGTMNQSTGHRAPVASADYTIVSFRSVDPARGRIVVFTDGIGSGHGARSWTDGLDVIYGSSQKNFPNEFVEHEYPIRVEQYTCRTDSGGPGFYRGGTGVIKDMRVLCPSATLMTRMNNQRFQPWGAAGGRHGRSGRIVLNPGTPDEKLLPGLADDMPLKEGDIVRIETCGGGGWGNPFLRPADLVRRDVQWGLVSPESAETDYGVALYGEECEIDVEKTVHLRAEQGVKIQPGFDRGPGYGEFVGQAR